MPPLVVGEIALAAVQNILFAVGVGILACGFLLPDDAPDGIAPPAAGTRGAGGVLRWRPCVFAGLALASVLYLCLQTALMSGAAPVDTLALLPVVLRQSHFGAAWVLGFAGTLVAAVSGRRPGGGAAIAATLGAFAYVAAKAASSHAADTGDFTVREAVHVVHLGATAVWAGSVIVATLMLRRRDERPANAAVLARRAVFCSRLSRLATYALAAVVMSGLYDVDRNTADSDVPLFDTAYGGVLAMKLAIVALALILGGYNRLTYLPRLEADAATPARRGFERLLAIEAVAMLGILAIAAVLGHLPPSGGA
ncbi:MAG: CopD family protein [Janthinobacterium lividum]